MSQQYNKAEKRHRRERRIKRLKAKRRAEVVGKKKTKKA